MASNEVKVSTMTFLADVPDDAKIYVVKPGVTTPYYTTKAALLASISGGTTPNFQAVTDGLGNNETTNPVKFIIDSDNYIEIDTANKTIRFYKDGDAIVNINENGISLSDNDPINIKSIDLNPFQIQGTTPGTSYSLIDGTLQLQTPLGSLVIHPEKITINGIDYPLPSGASSPFATLADIPSINENYKGTYTSLTALQTAHPTAALGNYAMVDTGSGSSSKLYIWDAQDGWVLSSNASPSTTDALIEGSTNLYFTVARVLATALTGLSTSDGSDVTSANSILVAIGKLQKQLTDVRAAKQDKEIWLSNISPYTLTSTTVLQKAFNIGTNGALDAKTRIYQFEGLISLSSLSSTSGVISFGFLGTATISSIRYTHMSMKGTLVSQPFSSIITTANQTVLTNSNINTAGYMQVSGIIRISGAGNLIPAVGMSVASAAVVDANSYFKFIELGLNTDTNSSSGTS